MAYAMKPLLRPFAWQRAASSLALVLILFYLGFHAVSGDRGVYAWIKETRRLNTLKAELTHIKTERDAIETHVKLLSPRSLDLDMLDEQARRSLGFGQADEIMILDSTNK